MSTPQSHKSTAPWTPDPEEWTSVAGLADQCGPRPKTVFDCERGCGIAKVRGSTVFVDFVKKVIIDSSIPCPNARASDGGTGAGAAGAGVAALQPSVKHARVDLGPKLKEMMLPVGPVSVDPGMMTLDEKYMASLSETQRHVVQGLHTVAPTTHRTKIHRLQTVLNMHVVAVLGAAIAAVSSSPHAKDISVRRSLMKKQSSSGTHTEAVPLVVALKNALTMTIMGRAVAERYEHLSVMHREFMKDKSLPVVTKARWFDEVALQYAPDITQVYDVLNSGTQTVYCDMAAQLDSNSYYTLGVHLVTHSSALVGQWIRAEKKREEDAAKKLGWKPSAAVAGAGASTPDTGSPRTPKLVRPSPIRAPSATTTSRIPPSDGTASAAPAPGTGMSKHAKKRRRMASVASQVKVEADTA